MTSNHRRRGGIVGMAFGALLAPPLISLLASPLATADTPDVVGTSGDITTYTFGTPPDTDTLSVNDTTFAFDNFHALTNYDIDIYSDGLGSHTHEVLLTDPGVFQLGVDDVDGVRTFIDSFTPADFINPDIGLTDLGGGLSADLAGAALSF